jgi:hypothetical protein
VYQTKGRDWGGRSTWCSTSEQGGYLPPCMGSLLLAPQLLVPRLLFHNGTAGESALGCDSLPPA